jgi:hypothetical protein
MPVSYTNQFRNYKDKNWLLYKYHVEKLSMDEICVLEGIHRSTLIYWFKKLGIVSRHASKRMTELYSNKDWLFKEYIVKERSAYDIAAECGCSCVPIYYWLKKFGFPSRYKGESKRIYPKGTQSVYNEVWGRKEYALWRHSMFVRDDFTCQGCGNKGGSLELHHIIPCRDYPEGIMENANTITLCKRCHKDTFGKEYDFVAKYKAVVVKKGL